MALDQQTRETLAGKVTAFNTKLKAIREDETLSDLGKRRAIESLYNDTKGNVDGLRGKAESSAYSRRKTLENRLFGIAPGATASDVIAYRDAQDRVARVSDPQKLGELMERASSIGDKTLLKAAFHHAYTRSHDLVSSDLWGAIVAEYVDQNPGDGDALQEYGDMTSSVGLTANLTEHMTTSITKPAELRQPSAVVSDGEDQ